MVNRKKSKAREQEKEAAEAAKVAAEQTAQEQAQAKLEEDKKKKRAEANAQILAFSQSSIQAIMNFGKASYSAASEFETSMTKIQMATGLTNSEMTATKMVANDLYKQNLGGSWEDLGGTLTEIIKLTDQQGIALEQTAKNALLLKDSIGVDVTDSVKSADTMMKEFGITSDQAFGLLAQGAYAKLDPGELTGAAESYAEDFNKLGFSANQMFDLFASGSQDGENSLDQIGKTFQQFEKIAGSGSAKSVNALETLGLHAEQVQKSIAAGGPGAKTTFDQIASSIAGISDPVKQNAIATDLFGSEFGDMEGQVVAAMSSARSQFDMTKQTMAQLNQQRINSPGAAFETFKKQITADILVPVGQQLLPALSQFGGWLTDHEPLISSFGSALAENFGLAIDRISSTLEKVLPYAETFIKYASDTLNKVMQWDGLVPVVMGLVGALIAYKTIVTTVTTVTKAWQAVSLLLSANPITLIIAAIIGLGVGLVVAYQKCEWFRNMVNGVWDWMKKAGVAMMNFFVVTIPNAFKKLGSFLGGLAIKIGIVLFGPIIAVVKMAVLIIKNWDSIKAATIAIFNKIGGYLNSKWQEFLSSSSAIFNRIALAISTVWAKIKTSVANFVGAIVNDVMTSWTNFKNSTVAVFYGIVNIVQSVFTSIWNFLFNLVTTIVNFYRTSLTTLWNTTVNIFNWIVNTVSLAWSSMWNTITGFVNMIVNFVSNSWNNIWNTTVSIFNSITNFILTSWTTFKDNFLNIFSGISDFFSGIWEGISSVFVQGINWIIDQINALIGSLNSVLNIEIFGHKLGISIPTIDHVVSGLDPKAAKGNGTDGNGKGNGAGGVGGGTKLTVQGYKTGLSYVPYDNFLARLHKGERVLTAEENKAYTYNSTLAAPVKVVPGQSTSPGSSPTGNTGSTSTPGSMNINLTVDVKGGSLNSQQTGDLMAQFRQAMQQVFQETMRRGGLGGVS